MSTALKRALGACRDDNERSALLAAALAYRHARSARELLAADDALRRLPEVGRRTLADIRGMSPAQIESAFEGIGK